MALKGRAAKPKGELHPMSKFTTAQVKNIKALCRMGFNQSEIAIAYNSVTRHINDIHTGRRWGHIE
jgi:Holliday junction resolvasome RuvABC DNA-binding subunit